MVVVCVCLLTVLPRGLAINAPVKVLDLVEAFGAGRGFKMEADCKVHILPSAQGAKSGSGI